MSETSHRFSPPPLPQPAVNKVALKVVRSFSLGISALVLWVAVALLLGLYVVSPPEKETAELRTLWEVLMEDHAMVFMLANSFYFLILIPAGIIFIATGVLRLPWWSYPLFPILLALGMVLLTLIS